MKITKTIEIMNLSVIIGAILMIIALIINWIMEWKVQYLFWVPMGAWVVSFIFAFVSAIKLPGGIFEKRL